MEPKLLACCSTGRHVCDAELTRLGSLRLQSGICVSHTCSDWNERAARKSLHRRFRILVALCPVSSISFRCRHLRGKCP